MYRCDAAENKVSPGELQEEELDMYSLILFLCSKNITTSTRPYSIVELQLIHTYFDTLYYVYKLW